MKIYKTKPIKISATKWTGSTESFNDILAMGVNWAQGDIGSNTLTLATMKGEQKVNLYDYIIKNQHDGFFILSQESFEAMYELDGDS